MLKKNVGSTDRIARIVLGAAMILAFFMVEGKFSWLYLLGIVPLATGLMSSCPLYTILGINTCPKDK
ncbi:DUF2892 domain-containing protein [Actibacterium sp. MT2.3-13A]|uniref:YgaP family membrane protein n=1 Tax=Actibacterium sp. MT2.3-13A TaxID=2828332 RepID=UPI001BAD3592|nr:DUF2892 domain-containing protein [Actibacterium sp. MT2.3-13A]